MSRIIEVTVAIIVDGQLMIRVKQINICRILGGYAYEDREWEIPSRLGKPIVSL